MCISGAYISKSNQSCTGKPSAHYIYVKTKILVDFHIYISVPLIYQKVNSYQTYAWRFYKNSAVSGKNCTKIPFVSGWSRTGLRSIYQFWGHLTWAPIFKKGGKRKTKVLHKIKKCHLQLFLAKGHIES